MTCFDAHSDIWTDVTVRRLAGETDVFHNHHYARLMKGGVEGSVFVIWVDKPEDYARRTREIFSCVNDEIAETKDFRIVKTYDEMMKAREAGVFYVFIGLEGMAYASYDETFTRLDEYYDFGARHGMLTWNEENGFGHSALSGSDEGLSDLGKRAVLHMIEKKMIVDTSHLNEAGFWDIVRIMDGRPFIASHSNCRKLSSHPRNLTDDQLRAVRDANGCVGLNTWNEFLDNDRRKGDISRMADHCEHMIDIMGIDHVGCGFDFCGFIGDPDDPEGYAGIEAVTPGIEDASKIPDFFDILRGRGMREDELEKIAYGNFHRIIKEVIG
ncbi:MAG: membrane dipeptidase [Mogibacterium sp.]|nr:membrane dipeptidase [Mogibacterium sp.]MBQ6500983.1 membrane dipeptidase [Mogibacterium sp.]